MRQPSPFAPTFGASPYILIGRDDALEDFEATFQANDPRDPGLTALIDGARGMGKTVLLSEYRHTAEKYGWISIEETARPGLMTRLGETELPALLARHDPNGPDRLKSLGFTFHGAGASFAWEQRHPVESTVRSQVEALCEVLEEHETGLVITVDEVTGGVSDDMQPLGEIAQFARTNDRLFALGASGLKAHMDEFLSQPGTTFLRRAERYDLRSIRDVDLIADAYRSSVRDNGRQITDEAAALAAQESRGYPFLIQSIGFEAWRHTPQDLTIGVPQIREAVEASRRRIGRNVHASALAGLSDIDKTYLLAMSLDDGPSRTAEVAARMGVGPGYASAYRQRLIEADVIEPVGRGQVQYTIPYLADALREYAQHEAFTGQQSAVTLTPEVRKQLAAAQVQRLVSRGGRSELPPDVAEARSITEDSQHSRSRELPDPATDRNAPEVGW